MASSDHISAGEKGKITAKIDIPGRNGILHKTIQVFSNDPKRPSVTLSLKAFIKP
jgi:hypothetical protein